MTENTNTHTSRTDADKHSLSIAHEQPLPEWFLNAPIQTEFRRGNVAASEGRIAELERELAAATARADKAEAALNRIANYDTGPLGRTDADAQRWRGMARAALTRTAQEADTYVDEDGDTVCIDTRTVIPASNSTGGEP